MVWYDVLLRNQNQKRSYQIFVMHIVILLYYYYYPIIIV